MAIIHGGNQYNKYDNIMPIVHDQNIMTRARNSLNFNSCVELSLNRGVLRHS